MKDQTIPFRVDEHTRQKLKATSERMSMSSSEFLRKAIWSYEELTSQIGEAAKLSKKVNELNVLNAKLNERLKVYEANKSLNRVFEQTRGYKINGIRISSISDLLLVITENTEIDTSTDKNDAPSPELNIVPIQLKAEAAPQTLTEESEPWDADESINWFKRNWLLMLILISTGIFFLLNHWVNKMSKRAKYINQPSLEDIRRDATKSKD